MADNGFKINKSANFNPQTTAPSNPVDGDFYYDSTAQTFSYYHNGSWANFDSVGSVASVLWLTGADFTPTVVRNSFVKVTGAAALSHLAGMSASFSAKQITIYNAGAYNIVVEPNDANEPTANNRIQTPTGGSMNLVPGEVAVFTYDIVATRWLLVSISSQAGAQVISTIANPGLVTLHQASLLPLDGVVLSDGDLNTATGVVGLDADKMVVLEKPTGGVDHLRWRNASLTVVGRLNDTGIEIIDPVLTSNVATKNYVDSHDYRNYAINGAFDFWQRGVTGSFGNGVRRYVADRWYAYSGAGATNLGDFERLSSGLDGFKYAARVSAASTGLDDRVLVQEIDRDMWRAARLPNGASRSMVIRFWARQGAGFNGTLRVGVVSATGAATDGQNIITGYTGGSGTAESIVTGLTTSWQHYVFDFQKDAASLQGALRFRHTPSSTAANNYFEITGIQIAIVPLLPSGHAAYDEYRPFAHAGGTYAGDLDLCQKYYEKSYDLATVPGTATYQGCLSALFTTGITGVYTPTVRYVRKWRVPLTVSVYSPASTDVIGNVDDGAVDRPTQAIEIGEMGCTLQNNAGTAPSTGARSQFHYVVDAEI
jgi:hypothetical protein